MDDERIEPTYLGERFTCPHCDHRTGQSWHGAQALGNHESYQQVVCQSCTMAAIWVSDATFVTQKGGRPKFGSTSNTSSDGLSSTTSGSCSGQSRPY